MPHTGRAHSGPVTSTTVQNTTPTSAVVTARMSTSPARKILADQEINARDRNDPVVATDDVQLLPAGALNDDMPRCRSARPMAITTQFATVSVAGLRRTRY